jgi:hypothetical protein
MIAFHTPWALKYEPSHSLGEDIGKELTLHTNTSTGSKISSISPRENNLLLLKVIPFEKRLTLWEKVPIDLF